MSSRTKTSADISCRSLLLAALLVTALLMTSCGGGHYARRHGPVFTSPHDFSEEQPTRRTGIASWYGPGFNGKLTASGEPYNQNDLTCAHKTFPLGTKVRVTNLTNGKSVVVTVNDRGPYVEGREIDLSYAAAKKLDIIGPGTAKVEIEPLGRDAKYVAYDKSYSVEKGPFTVQVASFSDRSNALELLNRLKSRYDKRKPYIFEADKGGKRLYRVRMGKFGSRDEAQGLADSLMGDGYRVMICTFDEQI